MKRTSAVRPAIAPLRERTLLLLDMHGTALNTDEPMLDAITNVVRNNTLCPGQHLSNSAECLAWLDTKGISRQEVLEGNKKTLFGKLADTCLVDSLFAQYEANLETLLLEALCTKKDTIVPRGFNSCVRDLYSQGFILGFVSNSGTDFLKTILKELSLLGYFHDGAIIGSDKKPKDTTGDAIDAAVTAVQASGVALDKVVFVGDAAGDRKCMGGYQAKPEAIRGEFVLMNLEGRGVPAASPPPVAPGEKREQSLCGFRGLQVFATQSLPLATRMSR